jgi:hypothetical protein
MLKEVIGGSGTVVWAEVALVVFFIAFVAICVRTWRRPKQEMDDCARIAIEDAPVHGRAPRADKTSASKGALHHA